MLFFNAFPVDRGKGKSKQGARSPRSHRGMAGSLLTDGVPLLIFPEAPGLAPVQWAPSNLGLPHWLFHVGFRLSRLL
ncbi:1-acyl-sn-glycerol-3-phosphate acyltransferase [Cutibacterium acnes JCM 18918]|nr:1-acyl-sn-glycerol-3-phosphate acyltransferase [Cutibacterium acnes JCM 18918]